MQSLYCEYYTALASVSIEHEEERQHKAGYEINTDCIPNYFMQGAMAINSNTAAYTLKNKKRKNEH